MKKELNLIPKKRNLKPPKRRFIDRQLKKSNSLLTATTSKVMKKGRRQNDFFENYRIPYENY